MSNFDDFFPYARTITGSFTPTVTDLTGNVGTTSSASGDFRKNGNEVHINLAIVTTSVAGLNAGERFVIRGLPFTGQNATVLPSSKVSNLTINATDHFPTVIMDPGVTTAGLVMRYRIADAVSDSGFLVSNWSATAEILVSGFYITSQ